MTRPAHRAPALDVALITRSAVQHACTGLAATIIAAIVGLVGFVIIAEQRRSSPASATLTEAAAFPHPEVRVAGGPPYRIAAVRLDTACASATTGELGALLDAHGCERVVHGVMTAPYGDYRVTAGIFELADETGAQAVDAGTGALVAGGRGSFAAPDATTAQVNWAARGRFLVYCAIARPDGLVVADDDVYAARITTELVNDYLTDVVRQRL